MNEEDGGENGSGEGSAHTEEGAGKGFGEGWLLDEEGGHGDPVAALNAEMTVDFGGYGYCEGHANGEGKGGNVEKIFGDGAKTQ